MRNFVAADSDKEGYPRAPRHEFTWDKNKRKAACSSPVRLRSPAPLLSTGCCSRYDEWPCEEESRNGLDPLEVEGLVFLLVPRTTPPCAPPPPLDSASETVISENCVSANF